MKHPATLAVGACSLTLLLAPRLRAQNALYNTYYSDIGGGTLNTIATGAYSRIGGGLYNQVYSNNSGVISGGYSNVIINGNWAAIAGGAQNFVGGNFSTVAGGFANRASNSHSFIGGGSNNTSGGPFSTIGGGQVNVANGSFGTVGGGRLNKANGSFSTIAGGYDNEASAQDSFAAGVRAKAVHEAAFVWNSVFNGAGTFSTNAFSFTVRAPGGSRFLSSESGTTTGVILAANSTSWASLSDSNAKTDIEAVDAREVLHKVASLPVTSWHYKHDLSRRYIGPMAQDFHAAFGLGADDKTISTLDTDGVTLAAIKGLVEELGERDRQISQLRHENAEMRQELREVQQRLNRLPPAP